jgi:hypothetical protein
MPNIVSNDFKDLGVLLADDSPIHPEAGEAKASLELDMDEKYWARGPISLEVLRTKLDAAGVELSGNTWLKANLALNPKLKTNLIEDLILRMRAVGMHVDDTSVNDWWMDLSSKRISLFGTDTPRAEGSLSIRTKNLQPALEALAKKDVISGIIPVLTRLDDFRAKTTFRKQGPVTDMSIESESDIWDVAGRVYSNAKQSLIALVIGGQAVSVGVAKLADEHLEIHPFAKTDWLNSKLAQFPKPLVQMPPAKP